MNPSEDYAAAPNGEVRIIDRWAASKLEFMSPSFLVENTVQSVSVPGLCVGAPQGQRLEWELVDSNGSRVMDSGVTECVMGNFQLNISRVVFSDCASQLELKAQKVDSSEAPAVTILRPFCDS